MFAVNPQEAHASNTVVTGTFLIDKLKARVLFDSGATHSFISPYFANKLARNKTLMKSPLIIRTSIGEPVEMRYMYPTCVIEIEERVLPTDLIELAILDFDVILGMDWLSENHATINCYEKCAVFKHEEGKKSTL